jgi:nucleotide-binding universal stress UspA family protein
MRSLNEILLPTDLSPRSADVTHYAAGIARRFRSRLTLLHVLPALNPVWASMGDAALADEVLQHQREATEDRLDRCLTRELRGLDVRCLVREGDPATVITEYAAAEHPGLIMMATRGCAGFRRFLLGSVAAKILHDVSCPVWTSSHVVDGRPAAAVIPKIIVCAVDANAAGEATLEWASDLAADLHARLIAAHAIPSLEFHPETYFLEADRRRSLMRDARAKISRVIAASRTPDAEVRVDGGSVAAVVRSVVEDTGAGLLIIGRASCNGMLGRLRTHSYLLIREAPCPVISI